MNSKASIFKVVARPFSTEMVVPTSKSYANRILILAALNKNDVCIHHLPDSTDVLNMLSVFKQIGLNVERQGALTWIRGSFPDCENRKQDRCIVETGDGGTTTRFLIPFLARGKRLYQVEPEGGMRERPMDEMLHALEILGVQHKFKKDQSWLEIQGPMDLSKKLVIDCKRSTQFASAFVLSCGAENISFENLESSEAYLKMTLKCVAEAEKNEWEVPVDFSSLSYPLALAAVHGQVRVINCHERDFLQADSVLLQWLEEMGAVVTWEKGCVVKKAKSLRAFQYDCAQCPDLVPTLAYLASFAAGESQLTGLEVLKYKESDRLEEISKVLTAFGVKHSKTADSLKISGLTANYQEVTYHPPKDHRLIMMTYLMMRTLSGGTLDEIHHVNKSFPQFFELMESHHSG